jgi:hypothetical protein
MRTGKIQAISIFAVAGAALIATSALAQLWNQPAQMAAASSAGGGGHAIAFVGSGPMGVSSGSTPTLSASYAISAGTHEGLVFCVGSLTNDVISVTYNGASATQLVASSTGSYYPQAIWYLPLGNTIAGSHAATVTTSANDTIFATIVEYSGIQQTPSPDGTGSDISGFGSVSVTTTKAGDWIVVCGVSTSPVTAGSGDTYRGGNNGGGANNPTALDTNGAVSIGSRALGAGPGGDNLLAAGLSPG